MSLKLAPSGMGMGVYRMPAYLSLTYLNKEQSEDVVFILAGVHAAAQFVAALPERGIESGFLEGHTSFLELLSKTKYTDYRESMATITIMQ